MSEDGHAKSQASRIGALTGIIFGLLLVLVAVALLFWNARQSVQICKTIKAGTDAVRSVPADRIDPANQGKLVHVTGRAVTEATLTDPIFGVTAKALRLRRTVEMYQWQEDSASYSKVWSDHVIRSTSFKQPSGHENPSFMPYQNSEQFADKVTLGAFTLPASVVGKIGGAQPLPVSSKLTLPEELAGRAQRQDGGLYIGKDPASPQIGDLQIRFEIVPPQEISIIARQSGSSLMPSHASTGKDIFQLREGLFTARHLFHKAEKIGLTWRLRLLGFGLMLAGLFLMLKMLARFTDAPPWLGTSSIFIVLLLTGMLFLLTIAAAWITFRPLLGIGLLAAAVALAFLIKGKMGKATPQAAMSPPPPPPPGS